MPIPRVHKKDISAQRQVPSWLQVEIIERDGSWADLKSISKIIHNAVVALVEYPKIPKQTSCEVCIALSSDKDVADLNWKYRGKKSPTNVLSFPASAPSLVERPLRTSKFLGDIIFARETIEREAQENNVNFSAHLAHLTVHGLLHLLGYDHDVESNARIMEDLETAILSKLGISDPYKTI